MFRIIVMSNKNLTKDICCSDHLLNICQTKQYTQGNTECTECPRGPKDPTLYPRGPGGEVIRPCMACKDTREARNNCVMEKVAKDNNSVNIISILQGAMACADLIEAHNQCMKEHGFKTHKYQA